MPTGLDFSFVEIQNIINQKSCSNQAQNRAAELISPPRLSKGFQKSIKANQFNQIKSFTQSNQNQKMKNLITTAILFLTLSINAQKHVKASGTHFGKGVDSKNWSNQTDGESTAAKFKDYSGESYIIFVSDAPVKLSLDYVLALTKGEGEVVFSGNGKQESLAMLALRSNGNGVNTNKKTVELEPGKEYRLTFKGKNAKGALTCNWTEL